MCGIAGIVGERAPAGSIERMTARLHHRGPDDSGLWTGECAQLGHARLSILDLSEAGHQPMSLGPLHVTYNGEIYNFRELRRGLPGPFVTECDTELILHVYRELGTDGLRELRGMFAFAIWDEERRRLFAARDRLGMKPFYYRELPGGLAFASEIKALLELGRPELDRGALRDYLNYKYVPAPKTIHAGIRQLPPAHRLTWEDGRMRVERYWTPSAEVTLTDRGEALERLGEMLARAVPEHALADVPVGVFLSGGIDSATVVAHLDRPKTFTLGVDVKRRDEAMRARSIAEHFGCEHHQLRAVSFDLDEAIEMVPRVFDEPFGDTSAWAVYLLSRLARERVKVVLGGDGGDELFCGYHWYGKWLHQSSSRWRRIVAACLPPFSRPARSFQRHAAVGLERYAAFLSPFTSRQVRLLLGPELEDPEHDDLWHFREHWREDLEPLKRLQWIDLHTYLPGDLLAKLDRASMAHSLELRPPLLDHRLVELALSMDTGLLRSADGREGKLLLRRLMRGRLPPGHLEAPKRGFNLPVRSWVRRRPELLEDAMRRLAGAGLVRRIPSRWLTHEQTWTLLVLDRWLTRSGAL